MLSAESESENEVAQSYLTLRYPMDSSPPDSSFHGIFQARILEWVAVPFSRGSSQPRDWTQVSCIVGRCFTTWAIRKAQQSGVQKHLQIYPLIGLTPLSLYDDLLCLLLQSLSWDHFVSYKYHYPGFLLVSIFMEYNFTSYNFQPMCIFRFEVHVL